MKTYTTLELEPILHCKKITIDRMCRRGELIGKKIGRNWCITEENLSKYLNSNERG